MAVAHAEHTLTNEQVVFAFGPDMTPVIEVDPGAVISLAMKDGLGGQITARTTSSVTSPRISISTASTARRGRWPFAAPSRATR